MPWSQNLLLLACGLIALQSSLAAQGVLRSCSYGGLFHVEQNGRYSLTYSTAEKLCMSINTTLATKEQIQRAFDLSFQTCRYGWIQNHSVVILRQEPYILCAANKTGIIISDMVSQLYDAYCFNASDTKDKNCELSIMPSDTSETFLDAHVDNESTTDPETGTVSTTTSAAIVPPLHVDEDKATTIEPTAGDTTANDVLEGDDAGPRVTTQSHHSSTFHISAGEDTSHREKNDNMIRRGGFGLMTSAPPAQQSSRVFSDWLVIIAVVAGILIMVLVCAVILSRKRWCGKKKSLVISGNAGEKGGKEQEMVQLMNKEKFQENGAASEEFTVITLEEPAEKTQLA
ncbi:UNVERIFIED_CONTAM: hypothetical protein FKN15_047287 [Acipenser sinensis]